MGYLAGYEKVWDARDRVVGTLFLVPYPAKPSRPAATSVHPTQAQMASCGRCCCSRFAQWSGGACWCRVHVPCTSCAA